LDFSLWSNALGMYTESNCFCIFIGIFFDEKETKWGGGEKK